MLFWIILLIIISNCRLLFSSLYTTCIISHRSFWYIFPNST